MTVVSKGWGSVVLVAGVIAFGMFRISPAGATTAPPNDDFNNATVITTTPFTDTVDTTAATSAPDDPSGCGGTSESLWYSITPSVTETVFASSSGPEQTFVSAYAGVRGALTQVACSEPFGREAIWSATAGVTYHLMVVNSGGPVTVQVSTAIPPPNDDFNNSTIISALPFTTTEASVPQLPPVTTRPAAAATP